MRQDGILFTRHFYLQDLTGGNQHLIKFLIAGDLPYNPTGDLLTREDYEAHINPVRDRYICLSGNYIFHFHI